MTKNKIKASEEACDQSRLGSRLRGGRAGTSAASAGGYQRGGLTFANASMDRNKEDLSICLHPLHND